MCKKLFSFVMGVYNTPENLLRNCLNSCLEQKDIDIEIVCVNDGSTDNSPKILEEYAQKYPTIFKIINQENKGVGPTKQVGIQHASGKYLWLIDADDRVRPNCVRSLIDALEAHNADQIIFPFIKAKKSETNSDFPLINEETIKEVSKEYAFANFCRSFTKRIIKKEIVEKANVEIPWSIHEDWPTTIRWTLECNKIIHSNCAYYMYVENDVSITHRRYYSPEFMKSSIKTLELLHKNISDFPEYTQWMVLNIIMSAEANLKRVRDSREMQEAQAPEIQEKFDETEKEYQFWLNRYSEEEKTLSSFFKNSREEILKSLSENKQKVSTSKHKLKRANQRISALENSASWKITAPLRAILKIFIKH